MARVNSGKQLAAALTSPSGRTSRGKKFLRSILEVKPAPMGLEDEDSDLDAAGLDDGTDTGLDADASADDEEGEGGDEERDLVEPPDNTIAEQSPEAVEHLKSALGSIIGNVDMDWAAQRTLVMQLFDLIAKILGGKETQEGRSFLTKRRHIAESISRRRATKRRSISL